VCRRFVNSLQAASRSRIPFRHKPPPRSGASRACVGARKPCSPPLVRNISHKLGRSGTSCISTEIGYSVPASELILARARRLDRISARSSSLRSCCRACDNLAVIAIRSARHNHPASKGREVEGNLRVAPVLHIPADSTIVGCALERDGGGTLPPHVQQGIIFPASRKNRAVFAPEGEATG